jgi:hypothetical protein
MTGTIIAEDEVRGLGGNEFSEVLGIVFQLAGACRSAIENDPADDGFRFDVDRSTDWNSAANSIECIGGGGGALSP